MFVSFLARQLRKMQDNPVVVSSIVLAVLIFLGLCAYCTEKFCFSLRNETQNQDVTMDSLNQNLLGKKEFEKGSGAFSQKK